MAFLSQKDSHFFRPPKSLLESGKDLGFQELNFPFPSWAPIQCGRCPDCERTQMQYSLEDKLACEVARCPVSSSDNIGAGGTASLEISTITPIPV